MRWERLFADLEARFDELADSDLSAQLADRQRVEAGAVAMVQRLAGSVGRPIRVRVGGGSTVAGALVAVGPDWVLVSEGQGRDALVAARAVVAVEGLSAVTALPMLGVSIRLDLRRALRGLVRDRAPVAMTVAGWPSSDAGTSAGVGSSGSSGEITGTIDRVGADFVEIAVHAAWEPRRAASVRTVMLVPLAAVMLVRALPLG
ncbi:MAG TPA: hypothetical protein VFC16_03575 [Nakamurella sp.]|jgi:hypothetical protein|nr:hypothetical protein [Nakamurella sp.]